MKIGPDNAPTSAICTSNPETIIVRGHDLVNGLVGRISFTDHIWLLVAGSLPSDAQRKVLDSTLVAIAEHGLVPSVVAARMTLASAPEALQGAVAAGILGCGSVILGASANAGLFFDEVLKAQGASGSSLDEAVRETIAKYRAAKRAIPGYGHPLHKGHDPRAHRLIEVCNEAGLAGRHIEVAWAVDRILPELTGKNLKMNVSGAIPAVLLDAGYPLLALKGVPILARTASLVGHLLEEQQHAIGFIMAGAGSAAIAYAGEAPEGFVPNEN